MSTSTSVSMREEVKDNVTIISFPKNWDLYTENANRLRNKLDRLIKAGVHNIILDLEEIDFACSEATNAIVNAVNKLRKSGGDLKILNLQGRVEDIFHHMRIDTILDIFESQEEALEAFGTESVH